MRLNKFVGGNYSGWGLELLSFKKMTQKHNKCIIKPDNNVSELNMKQISLIYYQPFIQWKGLSQRVRQSDTIWHRFLSHELMTVPRTVRWISRFSVTRSFCHKKVLYGLKRLRIYCMSLNHLYDILWCFCVLFKALKLQSPFILTACKRPWKTVFTCSPFVFYTRKKVIQVCSTGN